MTQRLKWRKDNKMTQKKILFIYCISNFLWFSFLRWKKTFLIWLKLLYFLSNLYLDLLIRYNTILKSTFIFHVTVNWFLFVILLYFKGLYGMIIERIMHLTIFSIKIELNFYTETKFHSLIKFDSALDLIFQLKVNCILFVQVIVLWRGVW